MAIRAVVFDIGGVLELDVIETVDIGLDARWEQRLGLQPGELDRRMAPVWRAGSLAYKYRFFNRGRGNMPALGVFVVFDVPFPLVFSSSSELKVWAVSGAR